MKRALGVLAIALAVVALIALRLVIAGRGALADGDDWMLRGKPAEAIRAYEVAARAYVPLAPHVDAAYEHLRALTPTPQGLLAWRAIRSAARATRSLWQPHAQDLADADAAIATYEARDPAAGAGAGATTAEREAWYRARGAEDVRPSIGAAALAGLGVLLWLAGAGVLVATAGRAAGRRGSRIAGAAIVLGLVLWLVGLYNA